MVGWISKLKFREHVMKTAFFCIFKCCCCGNAVGKYVPTIRKYTRSNQSGNRPAAMPVKESKARCVCVCACSRLLFCECVCLELEPKNHLSQELINYCRSFASCDGQRMNFRMLEKTVKMKRFLYSTLKYKYMMECNCVCWTG